LNARNLEFALGKNSKGRYGLILSITPVDCALIIAQVDTAIATELLRVVKFSSL
jgi:hypothetical protein